MNTGTNRRKFLGGTILALSTGPLIISRGARATPSNERITLGIIGYGIRSRNLLGQFLQAEDVQVVAVSEIDSVRLESALNRINGHYGVDSATGHADFRDLIARKDIDAIMIGTPDHWHAIPAIMACEAGKHVYCEKPLSLTIAEGRAIANAAYVSGVSFQTGSQQRTEYGRRFTRAAEAVRNGRIGKLQRVTVGVGDPAIPCDLPAEKIPDGIDWTMWNGPSPDRGFSSVLCPVGLHAHYPQWRKYREYANGGLADMGAHHFDIAQWAMDMDHSGPVQVLPPRDGSRRGLQFTYADGIIMEHGGMIDDRFEGTDGWIEVSRAHLRASDPAILDEVTSSGELELPRAESHISNWLDSIRHGTPTIADAETGHRTATICQLANIGYQIGRPLQWDPVSERFRGTDSSLGNTHLARDSNTAWQDR